MSSDKTTNEQALMTRLNDLDCTQTAMSDEMVEFSLDIEDMKAAVCDLTAAFEAMAKICTIQQQRIQMLEMGVRSRYLN